MKDVLLLSLLAGFCTFIGLWLGLWLGLPLARLVTEYEAANCTGNGDQGRRCDCRDERHV